MRVSVCMATHNGSSFVAEQVSSILRQLGQSDELVISDDQSSDNTLEILYSFSDPRIRILPPQRFGSPTKNFEYALTHTKGELIFLADQDDHWLSEKLNVMTDSLQQNELVVCDCRIVDRDRNVLVPSFFSEHQSRQGLVKNFIRSSFIGCCMAFHRKILTKALPFPAGISMHDQWIGLIAQKYFEVKFIPQVLVEHRRHGGNYSTTGGVSKNSFGKKVYSRFKLAQMLLQR